MFTGSVQCPLLPSPCRWFIFQCCLHWECQDFARNSEFRLQKPRFAASRRQVSSHAQRRIFFGLPLIDWRSSSFLVLPKNCLFHLRVFFSFLCFWLSFFLIILAHACPWVFFAFPCLRASLSIPSRGRKPLPSATPPLDSPGLRVFEFPRGLPHGLLQEGLAPRGQFTADGGHLLWLAHSSRTTCGPQYHRHIPLFQVMCFAL